MKAFRIAGVIALTVMTLQAEDLSLKYLGIGPINLHTVMTHEGQGERLIATAKNESGAVIQRARICIRSFDLPESLCLFELSTAAPWAPGIELNWNITTEKEAKGLRHFATIEEFKVAKATEETPSVASALPVITVPAVDTTSAPRLGADRRLFISPMEGKLDGFIAAEVVKQALPVLVVLDDKDVDLVLVGQSLKEDDHWYNAIWGGKDKNEGNLRLIDVRSRSMVWAGEAGDRSLIYGKFKRGGERKVAERLVRQMKKDYFR
jgi:hypothetical protein